MRQIVTRAGLLALAGCAVAATAACTKDATAPAAAPAPPSASSGVGAAASQGVGTPASPAASPSVRPVKPTAEPTSTGQAGQSDVDWKRVAFRELGCKPRSGLPKRAEVTNIHRADLTGDGRRETLVTASCPTTTSTNAVHVLVFAADSSEMPLLDIGKNEYLRTVAVQTKGRTVSVDAEALSDAAALCCPDLRVRQSWKWNGSAFVSQGKQTEKIS